MKRPCRRWLCVRAVAYGIAAASLVAAAAPRAFAETEIETLRREVRDLRRRDEENRAKMAELERMLREVLDARGAPVKAADDPAEALDRALAGTSGASPESGKPAAETVVATPGSQRADIASVPVGGAEARLVDISVVTLAAAGGSTANGDQLRELEGGGHDPHRNGFTLQQAELSLTGAVDPYFTGEAHIVATTGGVELEEAFFTTTALPWGLQVEGGYSLTEFGLINPLHAHAWDWLDQPVVATRLFGGEGLRAVGARAAWLMPMPFFSELHLGVQNADEGEFTASFVGEEGIGGRPGTGRNVDGVDDLLWLARWNASWDLADTAALLVGASVLYGPNDTGADGETWIYGADAKIRWRPAANFRGWPFALWQAEVIARDYKADAFTAGTDVGGGGDGHGHGSDGYDEDSPFPNDLPSDTLHDTGFYTQLLYGFRHGWAAGLRGEYLTGSGASIADGALAPRRDDPLRADRVRLSPLVVWHPTEFSRLRLQYNYDDSDALPGGDAHTVWVGAEVLYGKHGAHKY